MTRKETTPLTTSQRIIKGAAVGGIWGAAVPIAAVGAAYFSNQAEFTKMLSNNPESLRLITEIVGLHTLLWIATGGMLNGLVFPQINKVFRNLNKTL